jgi:hypothetical protein
MAAELVPYDLGAHSRLGNHVAIGDYSSIGGSGGTDIGEHTIAGQYFSAHPENHCFDDRSTLIRS